MRLRPALLLATVAAVFLAGTASAAGPRSLTFSDPAKDSRAPTASGDITGVTFTTTGTGKGKGYTPKNLVVTLALGAAPSNDGTTQYQVGWSIDGCEYYMQFAPGVRVSPSFAFANCGSAADATGDEGTSFGFLPQTKGSALEFKVLIKDLPNKVKPGAEFAQLNAWADPVDPTGLYGPASFGAPFYDVAATTKSYRLG